MKLKKYSRREEWTTIINTIVSMLPMPKEAGELASFLALVVDSPNKLMPLTLTSTEVKCFNKGSHGVMREK